MTTQGDRLKFLRKELQLSVNQIINQIGIQQGYYSNLENNNRSLSRNVLQKLNTLYSVSSDWLLTGEGSMFIEKKVASLEVVGDIMGAPNIIVSNLAANASPGIASQFVEVASRAYLPMIKNGTVAFPIQGKSMIPVFDDGDWVLCYELEKIEEVKNGSIYILKTIEGVLLCKYIIKKGSRWELVSENSENFAVLTISIEEIQKVYRISKVLTSRFGWES
jgi:transcriptional regulator with XRE-family HTH domain